ncbi:hypothetical protein [Thermococcus peptonophilus]|uniref:hypothetical protein n=1 Tax=Thermococcus peptonophilus TaxID=53952 RepID=UPI00346578E3
MTGTDFRTNVSRLLEENSFSVVEERKLVNGGAVIVLTALSEKEEKGYPGE